MNNENNVNATQNPNETNVSPTVQPVGQPVPGAQPVAPAPQAASTQPAESVPVAAPVPGPINEEVKPAGDNNLQTIVVPSSFPDEVPAATASPVSMPAIVNPLGDWIGGPNTDSGATNRKLGSDMAKSVTGGGLHGKDLSKADVAVNIYAFLKAQETKKTVQYSCAIGDETIDGIPYYKIVETAKDYIEKIGGFEKLAEWGLF